MVQTAAKSNFMNKRPSTALSQNVGISAIIPAYNEQKNIKQVLELVVTVPGFSEIIVVDDGSSDLTSELARSVQGIKLIRLEKNVGKTQAVQKAISQMKFEHFMLIDADLFGLQKRHLEEVISTYRQNIDMVILDYGNQELYLRKIFKSFPALSGVRILAKKVFEHIQFKENDRFELENRINDYFLDQGLSIIVVTGDTVKSPHKYEKYSFHKGLYLEAKALREIFLSGGARNIGKMIKSWWTINAKRKPVVVDVDSAGETI